MSFNSVGKVFTPSTLKTYLKDIPRPSWAKAVCVHHCAEPSLNQRPQGFSIQHIVNIQSFYQTKKKWRSGPHFFLDEDQIFGMTPPNEKGIHAVSFNSNAIGIEVLGDYDTESPFNGRGAECWDNTAATVKVLLEWLKLPINDQTVLFHRDDRKTKKSCPGTLIKKDWFISKLRNSVVSPPTANKTPEQNFVSVVNYFIQKGVDSVTAHKNITKKGTKYFWLNEWIEHAYYDSVRQATVAPLVELEKIFTQGKISHKEIAVKEDNEETPIIITPDISLWDRIMSFFTNK